MATSGQQHAAKHAATSEESDFRKLLDKEFQTRPELLQMRMENETIMAECRAVPRSLAECKAKLDDLLTTFPDFAEDAVYRRPVGADDRGNQKIAEGLSIRAAEALAEAYGYNRVRGDVTRIDANTVKVDATFTDFATGRIWQEGRLVSQIATRKGDKGGGQYRIDEQRFADVVVGAAKSKAIREVILRSVSPALKAWFTARCAEIVSQLLTEDKITEIFRGFNRLGITPAIVEKLVGRPQNMGWTNEDKIALTRFYAALKNGETTVDQLLEAVGEGPKTPPPSAEKPKVTMDDLVGKSAPKTEPTTKQPAPATSKPQQPTKTAEQPAATKPKHSPKAPAAPKSQLKPAPPPEPEPEPQREPEPEPVSEPSVYDQWRNAIEAAGSADDARGLLSEASADDRLVATEWHDLAEVVSARWDADESGDGTEFAFE